MPEPRTNIREYGHQAILKAIGFTAKELSLPRIAIINSWSEQSPGHSHLRAVADGVKAGVRMAGGMPFEINVPGLCSVPHKVQSDMLYDMPQREAVLMAAESSLYISWCDGWVGIASCDKIIPGLVLSAIRLNRPFIFLGGGQMMPCDYQGERMGFVRGQALVQQEFMKKVAEGPTTIADVEAIMQEITNCCATGAGACNEMTTGNTMAILSEGLGICLPGSSTSTGVSAEKIWHAKETGEKIMELVKKDIRPKDIITHSSMKNAIAVDMATCGGTNSVAHMQAYAHEAGIPLTMDDWDKVSRKVPALCNVAPSGPYVLYDYHQAGGTPAVMKQIQEHLDNNCITATGKTVGENLADVVYHESGVIQPVSNPVWPEGAIAVLKGNLAPRGAVVRHTVVENKELLKRTYNARVFDSLDEAVTTISARDSSQVQPGDAIIVRNEGPRGGPAMTECLSVVGVLKALKIPDVIVISDGRFSGFTQGYLSIGHVCPEAQVGGPLALVKTGDRINLDIPARKLEVEISDEELNERRNRWTPPSQADTKGALALYARLALQADEGAGWPTRWADFD